MKKFRIDFHKLTANLFEHLRGIVLVFVLITAVLSVAVGYRYYRYTQDEPQFCASCHLMKEAFAEWQKGRHRDVVCQRCHHLSVLEQNKLLMAFVVKGKEPLSQTHGREKPWKECKGCHMNEISQGSITPSKSYGHARHVFIQRIQCKKCHEVSLHNFRPDEKACGKCHEIKKDHGHVAGIETSSCLKCHPYK